MIMTRQRMIEFLNSKSKIHSNAVHFEIAQALKSGGHHFMYSYVVLTDRAQAPEEWFAYLPMNSVVEIDAFPGRYFLFWGYRDALMFETLLHSEL